MKSPSRTLPAISFAAALVVGTAVAARAQNPPPATKPQTWPSTNSQVKPPAKTPMGPPVSQSRHYPILLIAQGTDPSWNLRLGMKGPERLERAGYPPIPLEPSDVEQETTGLSWIYHAKDSQTNAVVAVHVSRETCTDSTSDTKYTFRVSLDHAQIGTLKGCAKVAPEQFPEFKQKNLDDDDPEKQKPTPPTVTNFKSPVAAAYLDATGKVMLARNDVPKPIVPKGFDPSVSHDGKRLMYLREENGPETSIQIVDPLTGKSSELTRGLVNYAFWSPDDSHIAFVKSDASVWHIWTMPVTAGAQPTQLSPTPVNFLNGWADSHSLVGANSSSFFWITDDGGTSQVLTALDLCGPDFESDSASTVRVNPANSDLLLVSGSLLKTPSGSPKDPKSGLGADLFLYELRSKRRVPLNISNLFPTKGEWSRDGLQIFFTSRDSTGKNFIYRIFWDATGLKKIRAGSDLVIGQ
ncbi:MAG TPA: hypothetical protein VNK47_06200 [Candidatus Dormibacteraeota bacterium]|nr:hypothetical protein [Candidatus Dormibacteraeota bacterium]